MLDHLAQQYASQMESFKLLLALINALVHLLLAGAVAHDAAVLYKSGHRPALVSAWVWAFATLTGGVISAAIYWFIHHSTLTRPAIREMRNDRT